MIRINKVIYGKLAAAALIVSGTLLFSSCHRGGKKSEQREKEVIVVSEEEISDLDWDSLRLQEYDEAPVIIKTVRPKYPKEAYEAGIEGNVTVLVYIDENGDVRDAVVRNSPGLAALEDAAKKAALECKFKPAAHQGEPVGVLYEIVMEFRLPSDE